MELLEWIDPLSAAVTALAEAAGAAGRSIEDSPTSVATHAALSDVRDKASALLSLIDRIEGMPPLPDRQVQDRLTNGLAQWSLAAENASLAVTQRDAPGLVGVAQTLAAGTDEFLRAAAALRRATGQAPDPSNPHS